MNSPSVWNAATSPSTAGTLTASERRYNVRPDGEFRSIEEIRSLVIDQRGLKLGDVANVTARSKERNYGRHLDGAYAIGIAISKTSGANMVEVSDRVMQEVAKNQRPARHDRYPDF